TARSVSSADSTQPGVMMGTPAFMPPEQARGEVDQIDERSDVFGLGAILCVTLSGKPPYTGSLESICLGAAEGNLTDAFARLDGCGANAELIALCKTCLAEERGERPPDAGEVARRLAAYQAGVQQRLRDAELERAAALVKAQEERKRR